MTKQPEDWLDDVPGDDIEDEDDEIIWVSKSEIKRDAEELKQLGAEMVELGKNALDKSRSTRICAMPLNWHRKSKRRPSPPASAYR
jgi:ribosomal 50S subunit-associated protein YjgA (DUF615 family)